MRFSIKIILFILLIATCFGPMAVNGRDSIHHVVANGENVYRISLRYKVPIDSVQKWNNLDQHYTVRVGQKLIVRYPVQPAIAVHTEAPGVTHDEAAGDLVHTDSLPNDAQNKFLPLYSEPVPVKNGKEWSNVVQYYYGRSNILIKIILFLNIFFIASVLLLLAVLLSRRIKKGLDDLKRKKCSDRYQTFIAAWLFRETTVGIPDQLLNELKDKVYREVFTTGLLSLHANLSGESAEKLVDLFHLAGLKKYSLLKVRHHAWHVKAKGFRELAQMKITDANDSVFAHLNSVNPILQIEAQLAWIQLNPGDPLRYLDNPHIRLNEWAQLNTLHSLKKISAVPDFSRWLQLPNINVTLFAIRMSGILKQFGNIELITRRLHDPEQDIRYESIVALGKMEATYALPELMQIYHREEPRIKSAIIHSLTMISDPVSIPFFEDLMHRETALQLRILAARGLASLKEQGRGVLDEKYKNADPVLRKIIIHAKDEKI